MEKSKVSVIIPTYKRPEKLPRAIDSVLGQTYPNVEVIVVDDNNPDTEGRRETEAIMASYENNPRVIYLKHETNKNGSAARNTGARYSNAEYLAFLDDDDEFFKEKIASQVARLQSLPDDYGCCYSTFCSEKDGKRGPMSKECREGDLCEVVLTRQIMIGAGSNLLVKKSFFDQIGGFDETFKRSQDVEFLVRLLKICKIAHSSTPGLIIYAHNDHKKIDFKAMMDQYRSAFAKEISALPESAQIDFEKRVNKEIFYYTLTQNKNIREALNMIKAGELGLYEAAAYTLRGVIKAIWSRAKRINVLG